jgi:hypothetical protein
MSSYFKIYDINLVDQATLTASTENAQFPVSNLKDYRRSKVYRSTASSANVVLDFGETSEVNGIFVIPNKRDGFGISTITVEFNSVNDFTSPPYSVNIPLSSLVDLGHVSFTSVFYRYARIVTTSTLAYSEISKIFIGKELSLVRGINYGWTLKDEELSLKTKNRYGQQFTDIITRQKIFGFAIHNLDKIDLELLDTMFDRIGESKPFYISIGDSTMSSDYRRFSGAVTLDDVPTKTNAHFNKYNLSISARELT